MSNGFALFAYMIIIKSVLHFLEAIPTLNPPEDTDLIVLFF